MRSGLTEATCSHAKQGWDPMPLCGTPCLCCSKPLSLAPALHGVTRVTAFDFAWLPKDWFTRQIDRQDLSCSPDCHCVAFIKRPS